MKKYICAVLAATLLVSTFAACSKAEQTPTTATGDPPVTTAPIELPAPSEDNTLAPGTDTTAPSSPVDDPIETEPATEPTEPNEEITSPTQPSIPVTEPNDKNNDKNDDKKDDQNTIAPTAKPSAPETEPETSIPPETSGTTQPPETTETPSSDNTGPGLWLEPIEPEHPQDNSNNSTTAPTEQPQPSEAPHQHSYTETKRVKASCTEQGSVTYSCNCGASYTEKIASLGHDWSEWKVVKKATYTEKGEEGYICNRCGAKDTIPIAKLKYDLPDDTAEAIAMLTKIYINELRNQEGACSAADMPGCDKMSKRRSEQMAEKQKIEHNLADWQSAATELKYGKYVDPSEYGLAGEPYYSLGGNEAVGLTYDNFSTVETIARRLADGVHGSAAHWAYVGSDDNKYISVGVTLNNGKWYCCVIVSAENLDSNPSGK